MPCDLTDVETDIRCDGVADLRVILVFFCCIIGDFFTGAFHALPVGPLFFKEVLLLLSSTLVIPFIDADAALDVKFDRICFD